MIQTMWKNANDKGVKINKDMYKMILVGSLPVVMSRAQNDTVVNTIR